MKNFLNKFLFYFAWLLFIGLIIIKIWLHLNMKLARTKY